MTPHEHSRTTPSSTRSLPRGGTVLPKAASKGAKASVGPRGLRADARSVAAPARAGTLGDGADTQKAVARNYFPQ